MGDRHDAQHRAHARVDADIRAQRVHHVDALGLVQLPGPRVERVGLGGQRAHRAQIDDVAGELRRHGLLQIGGDLHVLAAPDGADFGHARDLGGEAHAARTLDATGHDRLDQRAHILVFHRALVFRKARARAAIGHGLVLQVAFPALVADRAVQRVVDEQELHHPFAGLLHQRRERAHLRRLAVRPAAHVLHQKGARRHRLGRAHQLHKAHAAITGD